MKIIVGVKHVPDTETKIKPAADGRSIDEAGIEYVLNPYDEYAVEQAVQLVEKNGGEVVIVTVGKEAAVSSIRAAMAMGAHRGILVKFDGQFLDSGLTALALKAAIEQDGSPDLIYRQGRGGPFRSARGRFGALHRAPGFRRPRIQDRHGARRRPAAAPGRWPRR